MTEQPIEVGQAYARKSILDDKEFSTSVVTAYSAEHHTVNITKIIATNDGFIADRFALSESYFRKYYTLIKEAS